MELNKIYHMDNREGLQMLPEKCANLIISDPPYFEVKGDFDFVWESFDEYREFMQVQAQLYSRILKDNGTLFLWGHVKRIAYLQVLFDAYFQLENHITWIKKDGQQYQYYSPETATAFTANSERLLMYSSPNIYLRVRKILKEARQKKGYTIKQVADKLGVYQALYGFYEQNNTGSQIPTFEQWGKLRDILDINTPYEQVSRQFDNSLKLSDCIDFYQEAHITREYEHDTVKPETLTRALLLTCSRPNDLVVIPFAGSGTECAMAAKEGRRFIGFDTMEKYVSMGNKRVELIRMQPSLFNIGQGVKVSDTTDDESSNAA